MSEDNALTGSNQPAETPAPVATETVESPANQETETSAPENTDAADKADGEDAKPEKRKSTLPQWVQDLRRDKRNLQRQVGRLNQQIGQLRAKAPPRQEEFSDEGEYQRASFKRATQEASLDQQYESLKAEEEALAIKRQEAWGEIVSHARQEMPDFDAVFTDKVPVSGAMAELIMEADNPAQIAYWLGKNPSEALRIYHMSPVEAAREMGRLDVRLSAPKPRTVSSAPKPVPTVSGKAHQAGKAPEDMSYDEYKAWRMAKAKGS